MTYNPAIHHRQSIRLSGYDYSLPGYYFITICLQYQKWLLGEIIDGIMHLNEAGKMVKKWYFEIGNKFPGIKCDEHAIMPNHFHCIIQIPPRTDGPAWPSVLLPGDSESPMDERSHPDAHISDAHIGASLRRRERVSIFEIMDWFKTMSTNEYIRGVKIGKWPRFEKRFWQLRYWDRIVRNEKDLYIIRQYIKNNPSRWECDKFKGGTGICAEEESWME